jgi:hypothetical protein
MKPRRGGLRRQGDVIGREGTSCVPLGDEWVGPVERHAREEHRGDVRRGVLLSTGVLYFTFTRAGITASEPRDCDVRQRQ